VCGVLLGLGQVRLWNIIQTLPSVLIVIGFAIFVVGLDMGVEGAILAWTVTHVLTAAFALVSTRKIWRPLPFDGFFDLFSRELAWFALTMGAVQVVNLLSYRIELIVLERSKGLAEVGIYSIAVQTGEMVWLIAGALTTAVTAPALADDEKGAVSIISRTAGKALLYSAVIGVAMGALVPYAFGPVLGSSFEAAKTPLRLLLPGQVVYAPVTILVVYLSVRRGRPGLSLVVSAIGLLVTFVASLVLIPHYGASGAAASSAIGYGAAALVAWGLFTKLARTPEKEPAVAAASAPPATAAKPSA
jgi:O-antigen/teichoic acid export membrane protein